MHTPQKQLCSAGILSSVSFALADNNPRSWYNTQHTLPPRFGLWSAPRTLRTAPPNPLFPRSLCTHSQNCTALTTPITNPQTSIKPATRAPPPPPPPHSPCPCHYHCHTPRQGGSPPPPSLPSPSGAWWRPTYWLAAALVGRRRWRCRVLLRGWGVVGRQGWEDGWTHSACTCKCIVVRMHAGRWVGYMKKKVSGPLVAHDACLHIHINAPMYCVASSPAAPASRKSGPDATM